MCGHARGNHVFRGSGKLPDIVVVAAEIVGDGHFAKLAVERRAPDAEAAGNFAHAAAAMVDRLADDLRFQILEAAQLAVVAEQRNLG